MDANLRNFKDFLQLYNQMTEKCFVRCIDNTNSRQLESNEIRCVETCANKFIVYNNKLMGNFVQSQTSLVNRRIKEAAALADGGDGVAAVPPMQAQSVM